jgi:uncharacterized membrane protein
MWVKIQNNFQKHNIRLYIFLLVIVIVGAALRIYESLKVELWYDEIFTGSVVKMSWSEMTQTVLADRVHPLLYYNIIKVITEVFGYSELIIRSLSIISGIATIITGYFISKLLIVDKSLLSQLILPFLIAINPFFITYSAEARSYSFIVCLFSILVYFLLLLMKNKKKYWTLPLLALIIFTLINLHLLSVLYIFAIIVALAITNLIFKKPEILIYIKKNSIYIFTSLFAGLLFIQPILDKAKVILNASIDKSSFWWIPPSDISAMLGSVAKFVLGVERAFQGVPPVVSWYRHIPIEIIGLMIVIFIFLKYFKIKSSKQHTFIIISFVMIYLGIYFAGILDINFLLERYLVVQGLLLIILIFISTNYLPRSQKIFLLSIITLFSLLSIITKTTIQSPAKQGLITTSAYLQSEKLYFDDAISLIVGKYYYPNSQNVFLISGQNFDRWALISDRDIILPQELEQIENQISIFTRDIAKYKDSEYRLIFDFGVYKLIDVVKL